MAAASQPRPRDGRPGLGITQSIVLGQRNARSMRCISGNEASEKWAWLETVRANLTYGSEDTDAPDVSDLGISEREAIDAVMKSGGASSEGDRMRNIIAEIVDGFAAMKDLGAIGESDEEGEDEKESPPGAERVVDLLLSLRDIVGNRIDYANAFCAAGGLSLLLGAAAERVLVPRTVRSACLRVLADMVRAIRPLQYTLLDHGGIRALAAMYFAELVPGNEDEADGMLRGRVVQTMASVVGGHGAAEGMFCSSPEARRVIESGMGMHVADEALPAPPTELRRRSVAFLKELLVAGHSDEKRVKDFKPALDYLAETLVSEDTEPDWKVREIALKTLRGVLKQNKGKEAVLDMKEAIVSTGTKRMEQMRALDRKEIDASEVERVDGELYLWEKLSEELDKVA